MPARNDSAAAQDAAGDGSVQRANPGLSETQQAALELQLFAETFHAFAAECLQR
jgi:hypothetical protein